MKFLFLCLIPFIVLFAKPNLADKTQEEQVEDLVIKEKKWLTPTNSTCINKGGKIYEGICYAKWQDAKKICSATAKRLPTFEELESAVTNCDGVIGEYNENENNNFYQKCYKNKGFNSSHYWSSTTNADDNNYAWIVSFFYGFSGSDPKRNYSYVRCVR